jgi:2'-5' RNA ligase
MHDPPHRLFFALLPDVHAAAQVERLADALRATHPGGGWVAPSRYHATLAFLGECEALPDAVATRAIDAAARVRACAFAPCFDALDSFAGARAVWILRGPSTPWSPLVGSLRTELANAEVACDARPFAPHLTLRRFRERPSPVGLSPPITWRARDFVLLHSAPGLSAYATLGRWPLVE